MNLAAARGVAVRELTFRTGEPDYTLFVDGKAIGTIEAKPAGHSLTGVEEQSEKYNAMVKNLLEHGYCPSCVDVVLKYAANNLWKD